MKKAYTIFFLALFIIIPSSRASASRFWLTNVKRVSPQVLNERLVNSPNSLKNMGRDYTNGWSIAFYNGAATLIARSSKSPLEDKQFDQAVQYAADNRANLIIGHLEESAPSCPEGVDPYQRFQNGKSWLFGHTGSLNKDLLIKLIGEEYLKANPPLLCGDHPPDSWMESELYFIYLLKYVEQAGDLHAGLDAALQELHAQGQIEHLNFYLTDGNDLWVFRKGTSIYYTYDKKGRMSIVASDKPADQETHWKEIPEDQLTLVRPSKKPQFFDLAK